MNLTNGARLLRKHLKAHEITASAVAAAAGVSGVTVHNWLTGHIRPRAEKRLLIAAFTDGAVASHEWMTAAEREAAGLGSEIDPNAIADTVAA